MSASGATPPDQEARRLAEAARSVDGRWDAQRVHRGERALFAELARRRGGRARPWRLVALAAIPIAAMIAVVAWRRTPSHVPPRATTAPGSAIALADGSVVRLLEPGTRLVPRHVATKEVHLALERGAAVFEVTTRASRRFRVETTFATVVVRGTRFMVRAGAHDTAVAVTSGRVEVVWPGHTCLLGAGQAAVFPPKDGPCAAAAAVRGSPDQPSVARSPATAPRAQPSWRALARKGEYVDAYEALSQRAPRPSSPADLLLAADVARLSGHPAEAVRPLRELLEQHTRTVHAPVAAFTLGRVLADDLHDSAAAADAFARARALDRGGGLRLQALAREADARCRAGDRSRFEALVGQYLREDSAGPWATALRALREAGCPPPAASRR